MTAFIFLGDMLVMFFMIVVVVWVSVYESDERIDYTASIPLQDESEESLSHG
ncbi:MAG: hypothetical protein R3F41_09895 [Gammaproteobacteria bacterium]|nr:hypothetical protein [Pseudomonadales bacterium]MCP5347916.1 hypothetical protein [Pseudomonadales bacterium]